MDTIKSLLDALDVSPGAKHAISQVLSRVESDLVIAWIAKVQIRNRKVAGTFYSDLGAKVPFNDFVALYEALGYDFTKMDIWQDWWCNGALGCERRPGYTCNTATCAQ